MSDTSTTITKAELIRMLQSIPDDALIMFLTRESDIDIAIDQALQNLSKDPSHVLFAVDDSIAYEENSSIYYLVGKAVPLAS